MTDGRSKSAVLNITANTLPNVHGEVSTEIPSPADGVLVSIDAQEDETVDVGAQLGVIG